MPSDIERTALRGLHHHQRREVRRLKQNETETAKKGKNTVAR